MFSPPQKNKTISLKHLGIPDPKKHSDKERFTCVQVFFQSSRKEFTKCICPALEASLSDQELSDPCSTTDRHSLFYLCGLWLKQSPIKKGFITPLLAPSPNTQLNTSAKQVENSSTRKRLETGGCQQKRGGNTFQRMQVRDEGQKRAEEQEGVRKKEEHSRK